MDNIFKIDHTADRIKLQQQVKLIRSAMSQDDIREKLKWAFIGLSIMAIASFGVMMLFFQTWWVGGGWELFSKLNVPELLSLFLAVVFAISVAAGQFSAYQHPVKSMMIVWTKFAVIALCVIADIGMNMDKDDSRARRLSAESETFKATSAAINSAALAGVQQSATPSPTLQRAQADAAKARVEIAACERHRSRGQKRVNECLRVEQGNLAAAEAIIASEQGASSGKSMAAQTIVSGLIDKSKAMENDDNNRHPLVKLVNYITSAGFLVSGMMLSAIIMIPFEFLFLNQGSLVMQYKAALKNNKGSKTSEAVNDEPILDTYPADQVQRAALQEVLDGLIGGEITAIQAHRNGELFKFLEGERSNGSKAPVYGGSKGQRQDLVSFVIDALHKESIIVDNPNKGNAKNKPDYVINYKHSIFA